MSTLIAVYNSDGLVGRCDAKCYEAQHPECDCICGGMNHGAGLKASLENTREYSERWVDKYIKKNNLKGAKGEVNPEIYQLSMF